MPDREKVIKGLECCIPSRDKEERDEEREYRHQDCPYEHFMKGNYGCFWELLTDALAILKEQEPLEPITDENEHIHVFRCRKCNRILQRNNEMDYCPKCGQPIKWQ